MHAQPESSFPAELPLGSAAWRSWRSIKPSTMVWLWYLNALYWVGFFYLPRPEAFWVVIAYLAVGPMVFMLITLQRGLTRLSGLIHLPWIPLATFLTLRLYTDAIGPALSTADGALYTAWLHVLLASTVVCLVLDVVDVIRWLAGERYVLGTPAAADCGASRLAPPQTA